MKIENSKAKLLLHVCCACCATEVYNRLKDNYEVTLFWYNPNIYPYSEYKSRFNSFVQLVSDLECNFLICHSEAEPKNLTSVSSRAPKGALRAESRDLLNRSFSQSEHRFQDDKPYKIEYQKWQKAIAGLENEPEGGRRCEQCYKYRLEQTAKVAEENDFDIFATTLTISPHKNATIINQIGKTTAADYQIDYLESDFKKQDGFRKSIELSLKHNLYRQNYCGCNYSARN
jgi:hypothetical protein